MIATGRHLVLASLLTLGGAASAATLPTQWGVSATTLHADCSVLSCSKADFLFFGNTFIAAPAAGGLNATTAAAIDVAQVHDTLLAGTIDMGLASAAVEIDNGSVNVPILRARAASNSGDGWVGGFAYGIQGYEYTGATATTINLDAFLSGAVNNPDAIDTSGLSAGIWLIREDPSIVFPDDGSPTGAPASIGELLIRVAGLLPVEDSWVVESVTTGLVNSSTVLDADPLSIALEPGDQFYLLAALVASASGVGASADSFSTLTLSFDSAALTASGVPVPLPPAVVLLAGALAAAGAARKRRWTSR